MHQAYDIEILTEQYVEEISGVMSESFGKGPLIVTDSAYTDDEDFKQYLAYVAAESAKESSGLIARCKEAGQVIGGLLACDLADTFSDDSFLREAEKDPMIALLYGLNKAYFQNLIIQKNEYMNIKFLAVSGEHGGKGIAAALVKEGVKMAAEKGFRFVHTEATGPGSQRVFINKSGFEEKNEMDCCSFVFKGMKPFCSAGGQVTMKLAIKEL